MVLRVSATPPTRLCQATLGAVAARGIAVPRYDRGALVPGIVHIGVGGFHRAHLALYTDELAAQGSTWGIGGLGLLAQDATMARVLAAQDHLYTLVEKGNGEPAPQVIGSIVGYTHAPDDDAKVAVVIASPATNIVSMTITEAGYVEPTAVQVASGVRTTFDRLVAALAVRRRHDLGGVTVLSCDNLPGNGTAARRATLAAASRVDDGLRAWVQEQCTFPNSMVDRITPMTADADRAWLRDVAGIDDGWPVVAEPFRQWVIEDAFAAGRPRWEDVGALFTDRVHDWELYKLRLLNAGHSCMAYLAALADLTFVDEAMAVPTVRAFLEDLLYREAVPTLTEIPGHRREDYVVSVLERFANTGVRDQIARLCVDGSAKFPTFLLPTIVRQLELGGPIHRASTALAGWARYLGVVPVEQQSFDAGMDLARRYGAAAVGDPAAFLDYAEVFPEVLRSSERFRAAFVAAYHRIAGHGALAAMAAPGD
jgi:mannitol 2-dehydrogenase